MKMSELRKIIRKVLREAAILGGAAHSGAAGQGIDGPMAGPFRADANVMKAIELQVLETKKKVSKLEPYPEMKWEDMKISYEYDKPAPKKDTKKFINTDTTKLKEIDTDYDYDKAVPRKSTKVFVNDTNNFKTIGEGKMKIMKSRLKEIIKEEVISFREATTSGTGAKKQADSDYYAARQAEKDAADAYDTANTDYQVQVKNEPTGLDSDGQKVSAVWYSVNPQQKTKGSKTFGQKYVYSPKEPPPTKGYKYTKYPKYTTWSADITTSSGRRTTAKSDWESAQNTTKAAEEAAKKARRKTGTYSQGAASRAAKSAAVASARAAIKSKAGTKGKGKDTMKDKEREEESISMSLKSVLPKKVLNK